MKWALALLCLILLAPLALVDMPPLLDYPNHLARAVVLAAGTSDPILSRMYAAHWAVIPNLGTDLVLPPLLHLLPVHLAGRIVVGISILLPVAGTIAYSRAMFGAYSPWPLASGLVAYNATLLLGFLNFVAAIGIALLLAAGWIAWRERHPARTAGAGYGRRGRAVLLPSDGAAVLFRADRGLRIRTALAPPHALGGRSGTARRPCCLCSSPRLACISSRRSRRWPTEPNSHP